MTSVERFANSYLYSIRLVYVRVMWIFHVLLQLADTSLTVGLKIFCFFFHFPILHTVDFYEKVLWFAVANRIFNRPHLNRKSFFFVFVSSVDFYSTLNIIPICEYFLSLEKK